MLIRDVIWFQRKAYYGIVSCIWVNDKKEELCVKSEALQEEETNDKYYETRGFERKKT